MNPNLVSIAAPPNFPAPGMQVAIEGHRKSSTEPPGRPLFPVKRPHFFKIFLPVYFNELSMPKKFVRNFRNELSDVIFLKGPTGTVWRAELKETDGIVYLLNGWREFVEHHSLCIGYLLVFRYEGNSLFSVQVFDKTACEKEYPYASDNDEESCYNEESCSIPCVQSNATTMKLNWQIESKNNNEQGNTNEKINHQSDGPSVDSDNSAGSKGLQKVARHDNFLTSQQLACDELIDPIQHRSSCSDEKTLTELTPMVLESQRAESCVPFSERGNHGGSCPDNGCAPETNSDDSVEILAVNSAKANDLHPTKRRNRQQVLRRSLRQFVQSSMVNAKINEAKGMNDYKPRKRRKKHQMRSQTSQSCRSVELYGIKQENPEIHLQPSEESGEFNGNCLTERSPNNNPSCSKEKTQMELLSIICNSENAESYIPSTGENVSATLENHQTESDGLSSPSEDTENSQAKMKGLMNLTDGRTTIVEEKRNALIEATRFKSDNPFFIVHLKPSYVCQFPRMYIPRYFVKDHLSKYLRHVTLEYSDGQRWNIGCRYSNKGGLILSRGWSSFLSESKLEEGDVCVFELIQRNEIVFKVIIYQANEVVPLVQLARRLAAKKPISY